MCENCNLHEDNVKNNKQTNSQVDGAFFISVSRTPFEGCQHEPTK